MASPLKNKTFLIPLSLVALIILYHTTPLPRLVAPIREPLVSAGGIFFGAGTRMRGFTEGLVRGAGLSRELRTAEHKLAASEAEVARLRYLEEENAELRELLAFAERGGAPVLVARILSRNAEFGINTITLDRGSSDGVAPGLPVIADEGILIGKVRSVSARSAVVLLTTDPESTIAVSFAGRPEIQAIATGNLGISLRMELIPQDVAIGIGELAVSSSLESSTPSSLIVGRVAEIEYREGELFQTAHLEPVLSAANLTTAGVILPPE